jgi:hypothetical protein
MVTSKKILFVFSCLCFGFAFSSRGAVLLQQEENRRRREEKMQNAGNGLLVKAVRGEDERKMGPYLATQELIDWTSGIYNPGEFSDTIEERYFGLIAAIEGGEPSRVEQILINQFAKGANLSSMGNLLFCFAIRQVNLPVFQYFMSNKRKVIFDVGNLREGEKEIAGPLDFVDEARVLFEDSEDLQEIENRLTAEGVRRIKKNKETFYRFPNSEDSQEIEMMEEAMKTEMMKGAKKKKKKDDCNGWSHMIRLCIKLAYNKTSV